ncbi:MAG: MotA/TolQ/ExbB proton channel family protein [Thermoguttaceae bacterium]
MNQAKINKDDNQKIDIARCGNLCHNKTPRRLRVWSRRGENKKNDQFCQYQKNRMSNIRRTCPLRMNSSSTNRANCLPISNRHNFVVSFFSHDRFGATSFSSNAFSTTSFFTTSLTAFFTPFFSTTSFFVAFLFAALLSSCPGIVLAQETLNLSGLDAIVSNTESSETARESTTTSVSPETQNLTSNNPTDLAPPAKNTEITSPESSAKKKTSLWDIILAGGLIGYILILLSLVSIALMLEHGLVIRHSTLIPPGFTEEILKLLGQGQLVPAIKTCQNNPSVLAQSLFAGMSEYDLGWHAVERATEEAISEQAARLYRKIEYLNVIGNIAPMLGLLGTVVGMIFAFQNLAETDGYARAADLAEGIYLALITTVEGLIVAIPSLAAFSIFNNRIAFLIAETTLTAEQVLHPIKKSLRSRSRSTSE